MGVRSEAMLVGRSLPLSGDGKAVFAPVGGGKQRCRLG